MKRIIAGTLLMALLLGGCGMKQETMSLETRPGAGAADKSYGELNFSVAGDDWESAEAYEKPQEPQGTDGSGSGEESATKLIYRAELTMETVEFDGAVAALDRLAAELGGFIESSNVSGRTSRYSDGTTRVVDRSASYTLRVPSSRFSETVSRAGELGSVTNSTTNVENITSRFIDQEARKYALEVQEERLLAMLEKAEDVYVLVELESRLGEVRYEIESIERQLRNWQQQVDYSTVQICLREVAVYTPTASVQRSFAQKLADALSDGWSGFVMGLEELVLLLAEGLPTLVLLGAVAAAGGIGIKRWLKKRRAAKALRKAADTPKKAADTPKEEQ